ncbi:hypothetical protein G6R40_13660 [Chryseobacterium sp. POL2]|uniref:hypothetical protein n=1 Tax=Chryseobacterium sp. POL2 TaxID=2713414 RepID=UPI0013E10C7B|nr:hypothetical protein [Chryseobacterium sp. POL2]QIG88137.1 hypothetical protein G6R40_13660 [Chryseobacterium sp. POL2]
MPTTKINLNQKTMLRKLSLILVLTFAFLGLSAQETQAVEGRDIVDYISVPGPIKIGDNEYFLYWSKKNSATWFQQKYLRSDDDYDNYQELINLSFYNKEIDIEEAVRKKVESLQNRKTQVNDNYSFVDVIESPDGKEIIVDYLVTIVPKEGAGEAYAEYNIDRFRPTKNGDQNGFLIYTYSKRFYSSDFRGTAKYINKQRNKMLDRVITTPMPNIKLTGK